MKRKIADIAFIQAGYPFREGIEPRDHGDMAVIQIKDIGKDGYLSAENLVWIEAKDVRAEHFVRKNDVLLTTRGTSRKAAVVPEILPDTVFMSQIFSLRELSEDVLPEYLAWYLRQAPAQEYFETFSSGALIQNIKKDVLAQLEVFVPSIKRQKKILEIDKAWIRERELRTMLAQKRDQLIEQTLLAAIKD